MFKPPACVGRFPHEGFSQGEPNSSFFYLPFKKWFFSSGFKYFYMLAVFFCILKNYISPHAKNDECGYWCLQIWSRILHNWKFFVNTNFQKTIPFLQHAKTFMQIKLHSEENFLHHEKIQPPYFAGQIKRTSGTQHCSRFSTRRSEAVNSTEMHFIDEVSNPFRNLNAGPLIERLEAAC